MPPKETKLEKISSQDSSLTVRIESLYNLSKKREKIRLTDPEFAEKIKETKTLAEKLTSNFRENYKTVREAINIINDNIMERLEAGEQKSELAIIYGKVCNAFTYCNPRMRIIDQERYRDNFKQAVRDYLDFVQRNNISDQSKEDKPMKKFRYQLSGMNVVDMRKVLERSQRQLERKALVDAGEAVEIRFSENSSEKRFLVLFTGGTIGSVRLPDGAIVQPSEAAKRGFVAKDAKSLLLDEYNKSHGDPNITFDSHTIMETLSEDMTPEKLVMMVKESNKIFGNINLEEYDGVIYTHGSDTLGHTANFMALLYADIKVPMFFVSSNYVVTDARANGVKGFKAAVDFMSNVKRPGIFVTENSRFENGIDDVDVIYASRVTQCQPITDNYRSTSIGKEGEKSMRPLGVIGNDKVTFLDTKLYEKLQEKREGDRPNLAGDLEALDARVLWIQPHSGLNYDVYGDLKNVDVILHEAYHGGTACTDGERTNLLKFAEKCKENGKDLYFGPIYGDAGRDVYGSTDKLHRAGVSTIMNVSREMAFEKLRLAYSLFKDDEGKRNEIIYKDINHEFVLPDTKLER